MSSAPKLQVSGNQPSLSQTATSSKKPALISPTFSYLGLSGSSAFKKLPTPFLEGFVFGCLSPDLFAHHPHSSWRAETESCTSLKAAFF